MKFFSIPLCFFILTICWSCGDTKVANSTLAISDSTKTIATALAVNAPKTEDKAEEEVIQKLKVANGYQFPYQLQRPQETIKLSHKLVEISGLGLTNSGKQLCAVQDEVGSIFFLDKKSGKIDSNIKFWKSGDYEGVEMVGEKLYVVNSSGTIYEVENLGEPDQKVEKYNTFLKKDNDVEGLCYDAAKNRLLLACKGRPATGESLKSFRFRKCIYGFNLETKLLDSLPAYTIHLDQIQAYLKSHPMAEELNKLIEFFTPDANNLTFNPSAIAIHPISNNIYLTSSVGKVLIVMDKQGKILYIEKLRKKLHPQPEGLAFDKGGILYISNEGKEGKARIHRFVPASAASDTEVTGGARKGN